MSKQDIIDKLTTDCSARCDAILLQAQEAAAQKVMQAKEDARTKLAESGKAASLSLPELKRRSRSVAELEAKKLTLAGRQEVLSFVFERALQKLCALPEAEYLAIIRAMLLSAAENGDSVVAANADRGRVTPEFILSVANEAGIKLGELEYGDFAGGIVLKSANCDKNLSFEVELSSLREELEPKLAAMVF